MRRVTRTNEGIRVLLSAVFRRDEDGKVMAVCQELPVDVFADSVDEAEVMLREAITSYFDAAHSVNRLNGILATLDEMPTPEISVEKLKLELAYAG